MTTATLTATETSTTSFSSTTTFTKMSSFTSPASRSGPIRHMRLNSRPQTKKRAGYGLFYSDDEDEQDYSVTHVPTTPMRPSTTAGNRGPSYDANRSLASTPVRQGNASGIKSLVIERQTRANEDLYGSPAPSPVQTPVAHTRRRDSRQTPYRKPTANDKKKTTLEEQDDLTKKVIGTPSPARDDKTSKYTMSGAGNAVTPSKASRRGNEAPQTPAKAATSEAPQTPGGIKYWGTWIKSLVQTSAKKLVPLAAEGMSTDMDLSVDTPEESSASGANTPTPAPVEDNSTYNVPGGFVEAAETPAPEKKEEEYINPLLAIEYYNGKIIGLPQKPAPRSFAESLSYTGRYSALPPRRLSAGPPKPLYANRPRPRESSAPSAVHTSPMGYKRQRTTVKQGPMTEEMKQKIEEERLAEIQQKYEDIKRERRELMIRAQELEYEWRIVKAQMGKPVNFSDAEASDSDASVAGPKLDKGKGKAVDVETPEKEAEGQLITIRSPAAEEPESKATTPPPVVPSKPSSFLFGGGAYSPADAPPPPIIKGQNAVESAVAEPAVSKPAPPVLNSPTKAGTESNKSSFSSDSDKENATKAPSPPATPTLSHAQLPTPLAATGPTFLPPPSQVAPLSPQKGSMFFGDAASKARSKAEKHKPHVSSGLRASTIMQSDSPPRSQKADEPSFGSPAPQMKPLNAIPEAGLFQVASPQPEQQTQGQEPISGLFDVKKHVELVKVASLPEFKLQTSGVKALGVGSEARGIVASWSVPSKDEMDGLVGELLRGVRPVRR